MWKAPLAEIWRIKFLCTYLKKMSITLLFLFIRKLFLNHTLKSNWTPNIILQGLRQDFRLQRSFFLLQLVKWKGPMRYSLLNYHPFRITHRIFSTSCNLISEKPRCTENVGTRLSVCCRRHVVVGIILQMKNSFWNLPFVQREYFWSHIQFIARILDCMHSGQRFWKCWDSF